MDTFEILIHEWYEKLDARCTETEIDEARNNYDLCLRLYHEITEVPKAVIRIYSRDFEYLFYCCPVKLLDLIKFRAGTVKVSALLIIFAFTTKPK